MNYKNLIYDISKLMYEKGKILSIEFNKQNIVSNFLPSSKYESDLDISTNIEKEIELDFYYKLKEKYKNLGFYLEENSHLNDLNKEFICYIDPIDGTKYFTKQIPLFNISVGITKNNESMLGVTYNPIANQLHTGAFGIPTTLNSLPVSVSNTKKLQDAFVALDVSTHKENWEQEKDWINQKIIEFNLKAKRIRLLSAGAVVTSWVSHGGLDAYVSLWGHGSKQYDIAAGKALIKYSKNGNIIDLKIPGLPDPRFIGGNQYIVNEICELLLR